MGEAKPINRSIHPDEGHCLKVSNDAIVLDGQVRHFPKIAQMLHEKLVPVSVSGKRLLYAATVFWSALLLLLVQPVLTKAILPWFGGSAGVWTTSMLFYQSVLLLGYAYAHLVARWLPLRVQVILHVALLLASLLLLPVLPPWVGNRPPATIRSSES